MQHLRTTPLCSALAVVFLVAGCSTTSPGVTYYQVGKESAAKPKNGFNDVFALDVASLKIVFPEDSQSGDSGVANAAATQRNPSSTSGNANPQSGSGTPAGQTSTNNPPNPPAKKSVDVKVEISESGKRIGLSGTNDYRKTTMVNITKRDNTDMVQSIGVETTENLKNSITKLGTLLVGIVKLPLLAEGSENCKNVNEKIVSNGTRDSIDIKQAGNCATYTLGPVPDDAIRYSEIPWGKEVNTFYYSACRTLEVTLTAKGSSNEKLMFKVPDPEFVQAVHFPFKGSIKKHTTCGVSTVTEGVASPSGSIEALTELLTQINAIRAAKDGN